MARPAQVVEVPRFLLPGIAWNGTPLRTTVVPREVSRVPGTKQQRRQLSGQNTLRRNSRTLFSPYINNHESTSICRRLSTTSSSVPATRTELSRNNSTDPITGTPVRYNGVYVAAFKPARRAFHVTAQRPRDHHFDTLKFVRRLKQEGFSEEQAVATMRVLSDVIEESIQNLTRTMVLKEGEFIVYGAGLLCRGCWGYLLGCSRGFGGWRRIERKRDQDTGYMAK